MANEIISYRQMCEREKCSLQRGMYYRPGDSPCVLLMSVRRCAPYQDRYENEETIIYEGHDARKSAECPNPKDLDQPAKYPTGLLTENGKFASAVEEYKSGQALAKRVRVYGKVMVGVWSYNGLFELVDFWLEHDGQ